MVSNRTITVFGATGAQGGGLAHAILNDEDAVFSVRAVTRDAGSEKAKALEEKGAEIVTADFEDYDSLVRALEGTYGAYFVTSFWEHFSPETELKQARNMAKAATETGVQHAIWSSLEDVRKWVPLDDDRLPTLQGKYKVPHFDAKGEADKYFEENNVPTTFMYASFYWDNMIHFGMGPKRQEDGTLAIAFPMGDKKLAGIAADDIGKCAYGIFRQGRELTGKYIGVAGEHLTCHEMAEQLSEALGEKVVYNELTPDQFRGLGFAGAEDLGNMFQFYRDFDQDCLGVRDVATCKKLNPQLKSFQRWLNENASRIPIE